MVCKTNRQGLRVHSLSPRPSDVEKTTTGKYHTLIGIRLCAGDAQQGHLVALAVAQGKYKQVQEPQHCGNLVAGARVR